MTTSARGEMPLPPQDDLAEQHVLGTALMSAAAVDIVRELTADHFTPGRRQDVFRAIVALDSSGVPVEPETVLEELTRRGRPDSGPLLLDLQQCAVPAESLGHWIDRLRSVARDRAGMQIGQRLGQLYGQPPSEHRDQALAETAAMLAKLAHAEQDAEATHARRVQIELDRLRVTDDARRALAAEQRGPVRLPEILTLRERLARPRPPKRWRISGWQPAGSRVMLAAQFKAGKTTMTGNVVRTLVDGDRWLGRHEVADLDGNVVVLDFEMSGDQLDDWLRDQRIRNDDRVILIPLRGMATAFDIVEPRVRAQWAARLRHHQAAYLIVDCLRPILDALGLDEHRDAGRFLTALDALLVESGIADAMVVHHMGHNGERSRGDSRIRDWPDVEWRLVRQDDEPASPRFITAYGRDVDIPESQLHYDPATRHLTLAGGSRKDAAARSALPDVLAVLRDSGELSGRKVEETMKGSEHGQKAIREALKLGVRIGSIEKRLGPDRSHLHRCVSASGASPVRQRTAIGCVGASIDDAPRTAHETGPGASGDAQPSSLFPTDAGQAGHEYGTSQDDDDRPCDRCQASPSRVAEGGTWFCRTCAPSLWKPTPWSPPPDREAHRA